MLEPTAATFSKDRTERALVADEDDRQVPTYLPRYPVLSLVWLAITADIVTAVVRTRQEHATEYSIFNISSMSVPVPSVCSLSADPLNTTCSRYSAGTDYMYRLYSTECLRITKFLMGRLRNYSARVSLSISAKTCLSSKCLLQL